MKGTWRRESGSCQELIGISENTSAVARGAGYRLKWVAEGARLCPSCAGSNRKPNLPLAAELPCRSSGLVIGICPRLLPCLCFRLRGARLQ